MKNFRFKTTSVIAIFALLLMLGLTGSASAATSPSLGAADTFNVLAQSGITGTVTSPSGIIGNVENNAIAAQITALTTLMVNGLIYSSNGNPTGGGASTLSLNAAVQNNTATAFGLLDAGTNADAQCIGGILPGGTELTTLTQPLAPGLYCTGTLFNLTGHLTLAGTSGTWVFKTGTGITVANGASVTGGDPCNVWWRIGSTATIGSNTSLIGTIIAGSGAITFGTNFTLNGRALTLGTNVTLNSGGTISGPICSATPHGRGGTVASVAGPTPLINVTKIPSPLALPTGPGPVTYTYTVTNIGVVPMSDVWVKDDKCDVVKYISGDTNADSKLDLNEAWVYTCTKTVSITETNTVTAHGAANGGEVWDTANATVVVGAEVIPPIIHLVKKPNVFVLPAGGGAVTYTYTVTNPGTAPLSNVSIFDDKCTGLPGRVIGHPGDLNKNNLLESNEIWTFTCQSSLNQTTTNIGMAEGSANGLTALDFSPATVVVLTPSLPNTGLFTDNVNATRNIAILVGIILVIMISLVLYFKRRTV